MLVCYYYQNVKLFKFHQFFHEYSSCPLGTSPGHHTAFSCHVSIASSGLWKDFSLSLFFMTLTVLRIASQVLSPSVWVFVVFSWLDWSYYYYYFEKKQTFKISEKAIIIYTYFISIYHGISSSRKKLLISLSISFLSLSIFLDFYPFLLISLCPSFLLHLFFFHLFPYILIAYIYIICFPTHVIINAL